MPRQLSLRQNSTDNPSSYQNQKPHNNNKPNGSHGFLHPNRYPGNSRPIPDGSKESFGHYPRRRSCYSRASSFDERRNVSRTFSPLKASRSLSSKTAALFLEWFSLSELHSLYRFLADDR